ncbi:hypothetical protein [Bradyrhizobium sp.]|uniref:hypothetical protein n=1 Tax=Bradyrhizobium sp. TaxID=376 RepID=UPI0025BD49D1|nr:hypothetical protein [Bradyrhizobium sp.]MCA3256182.1 hypothetical protein [Alphaproteobacteria bacterium]MCA3567961.1 hypothetical protein [Bradyrhizobium sp.]
MSFDQRPAQTKLRVVSPALTPAVGAPAAASAAGAADGAAAASPGKRALPIAFVLGALIGGAAAAAAVRATGVDVVALLSPPAEAATPAPAVPENFDPR